jgi:hypothetical protein
MQKGICMSGTFRQACADLADFMTKHPEIEIGESVTSIPENVRPDFYALFNAARHAFIAESFPGCLSRAGLLQQEYCKAAQEASQWLSFEDGPVVSKCGRFLNDPKDSLARELFDPLFDLLKKRETPGTFEQRASSGIEALFPVVHRGGYEKWAVLSLANLLEVQKAYRVPIRDLQPGDRAKSSTYAPMEEVPAPVESTNFYFSQSPKAIFAAPDFIVRSGKLNKFIGFRSEFKEGLYNALNASMDREWIHIDADLLILLEGGLTLVYTSETPASIALVGDVAKFCRPDLVLWCVDSRTLTRKEALEKMARADKRLSPAKGVFVIANEPWPESAEADEAQTLNAPAEGASPRIRILTAGFDSSRLMPVVEAFSDEDQELGASHGQS